MADSHGSTFSGGMTAATEEFQEEDVWGLVMSSGSSTTSFRIKRSKSGPTLVAWRSASSTHLAIPRSASSAARGGLKNLQSSPVGSSPVEIRKETWWDDDDANAYFGDHKDVRRRKSHHVDDDDDIMVPPHELLAMRMRRTDQVAYSMCEGIGRTLKGRDLVNLRNTILAKTGFLELSP